MAFCFLIRISREHLSLRDRTFQPSMFGSDRSHIKLKYRIAFYVLAYQMDRLTSFV